MTLLQERLKERETRLGYTAQPTLNRPFTLVCLTVASWAIAMMSNPVFIDESVYIRAGRAYLAHWVAGAPLPEDVGAGFSGLPVLYPVLAAGLDQLGGLTLVRGFSLACILATMFVLRSLTTQLFNHRAGMMAALMFGLTGPVLYLAQLATFDALVILLLVLALRVGMLRQEPWSGVAMLALLTLAVCTKYTAYVFVPPILVLSLFSRYALAHSASLRSWWQDRRLPWGRITRSLAVAAGVGGSVAAVYLAADDRVRESIAFTTTQRSALSPAPRDYLAVQIPEFAWPVLFAAVLGLVWLLYSRRWSAAVWGLGLLATALLLPVAQIKLGEAVSFQKHLAYSTAFLAPLAGWGLARPWRLAIWTPVLVWFAVLVGMWGLFRSHDLMQYPDVRPVVANLELQRGVYLSSSADSLAYYTIEEPGIQWRTTFELYSGGPEKIRAAVREQRYEAVVIHAGPTGSSIQDAGQRVLLDALERSDYSLERLGEEQEWLVYTKE